MSEGIYTPPIQKTRLLFQPDQYSVNTRPKMNTAQIIGSLDYMVLDRKTKFQIACRNVALAVMVGLFGLLCFIAGQNFPS